MEKSTFALPPVYNENVLTLMVCSPTLLFAYWDFTDNLKTTLHGCGNVYLCLYDVDKPSHDRMMPAYKFDSGEKEQNCYFTATPGVRYRCKLGFINKEGTFIPLLASNTVIAPSIGMSLTKDCPVMSETAVASEYNSIVNRIQHVGYSGTLFKK